LHSARVVLCEVYIGKCRKSYERVGGIMYLSLIWEMV
jgi:hypothetical protein